MELPMSRGLGVYAVDEEGRLQHIRDSWEHTSLAAYVGLPALGLAAPLLKGLAPLGEMAARCVHERGGGAGWLGLRGVA